MTVAENTIKRTGLLDFIKNHEYEIILLVFLLSRFVLKNILGLAKYFTVQSLFGLSNSLNVALGVAVVLIICICLASVFGQLIRKNGKDFENATLILVALFFACPATLPFLFDTNNLSGTQMLYPFALFVFAVYLIGKSVVEWFVPLICVIYFIPSLYTSKVFFTILGKEAILYVPLILLFLFLDMMKNTVANNKYIKIDKDKAASVKKKTSEPDMTMFVNSLLVSIGSIVFTLVRGKFHFENPHNIEQKVDGYLMVCLLISSPLLFAFGAVLYSAVKRRFSKLVFHVYLYSFFLLFPLFWNNYYGLWVPFFTISLSLVVFYFVWQKNPAMLSAVQQIGKFFTKHKLLFYFVLFVMASLSNTSTIYASSFLLKIFSHIPY